MKAARVWLTWGAERAYWLVWARNRRTGEEKYFISNAAADEPVERIMRAAFCRWNVEHGIRLSKGEIGFRHFEGRSYVALLRHWVLCCVTLTFVASHAAELRGEKRGGDGGAGVSRAEPGLPGVVGAVAGDDAPGVHICGHSLPPAEEPGGAGVPAASPAWPSQGVYAGGVTPDATPPKAKKRSTTTQSRTVALCC